jgi:hypothetical protein
VMRRSALRRMREASSSCCALQHAESSRERMLRGSSAPRVNATSYASMLRSYAAR